MSIIAKCPCGKSYKVDEKKIGKSAKCIACGNVFKISPQETKEASSEGMYGLADDAATTPTPPPQNAAPPVLHANKEASAPLISSWLLKPVIIAAVLIFAGGGVYFYFSPYNLKGDWEGTTDQGKPVSFTFENGKIRSFSFPYEANSKDVTYKGILNAREIAPELYDMKIPMLKISPHDRGRGLTIETHPILKGQEWYVLEFQFDSLSSARGSFEVGLKAEEKYKASGKWTAKKI